MKTCLACALVVLALNASAQTRPAAIQGQPAVPVPIPAEASLLTNRTYNLLLNCAGLNNDLKRVDEVLRKRVPLHVTPADTDQPVRGPVVAPQAEHGSSPEDRQLLLERSHIERLRAEFRCSSAQE